MEQENEKIYILQWLSRTLKKQCTLTNIVEIVSRLTAGINYKSSMKNVERFISVIIFENDYFRLYNLLIFNMYIA